MLPPQEIHGTFTHTCIRAQLLLHHLVLGSERLLLKCVVDWLLVHRLAVHPAASDQDGVDQVVRYTLDRLAVEDGQQGVLHHQVPDSSAAGRTLVHRAAVDRAVVDRAALDHCAAVDRAALDHWAAVDRAAAIEECKLHRGLYQVVVEEE